MKEFVDRDRRATESPSKLSQRSGEDTETTFLPRLISRRRMLQGGMAVTGAAVLARFLPETLSAQTAAAPNDAVAAMRAQIASAPMKSLKLGDSLTMLYGPGGNVVVSHGADGKFVVDTFVRPVWAQLKQSLDALGNAPLRLVINTHWHFDHTDNNAAFRAAGAAILSHENTKQRLSESHDALGMHFDPAPANALPTQTFKDVHTLQANGEKLTLTYFPPAHTDTDIYIHYPKSNVVHMADVWFNGTYPFLDTSTGGNINGTISASNKILALVDSTTKIVPGHGPLGDKVALTKYRDVLVAVRDRVQKQKAAGKILEEVIAAKPTSDFDETWGKGFTTPDRFVTTVYNTL